MFEEISKQDYLDANKINRILAWIFIAVANAQDDRNVLWIVIGNFSVHSFCQQIRSRLYRENLKSKLNVFKIHNADILRILRRVGKEGA